MVDRPWLRPAHPNELARAKKPADRPERIYPYRPLRVMTYLTLFMLALHMIGLVAGPIVLAGLAPGIPGLAALALAIVMVASYVVGGVWIYRAACNVRALGARGLRDAPGWAVGWYFVPIAWLWRPLVAMSEIYRASETPHGWASARSPALLGWWWALWLISGFLGTMINGRLGNLTAAGALALIQIAVDMAEVALFAAVVWRVYRAQRKSQCHEHVAEVFA